MQIYHSKIFSPNYFYDKIGMLHVKNLYRSICKKMNTKDFSNYATDFSFAKVYSYDFIYHISGWYSWNDHKIHIEIELGNIETVGILSINLFHKTSKSCINPIQKGYESYLRQFILLKTMEIKLGMKNVQNFKGLGRIIK